VSEPLLLVDGLAARYGEMPVLWGISLHVSPGEMVALVGANGAGKSTTLKVIAGLHPMVSGEVRFLGRPTGEMPYYERVQAGMSLVPEGRGLFPGLTVSENLRIGAYVRWSTPGVDADLERMYGLFPRLRERRTQLAGTLSGGEQQMCAIARGLMARPRLLMIDELSLGLAPVAVDALLESLRSIVADGVAILLVEQDVGTALDVASRGYVLELGSIVMEGTAKALLENPKVQKAYLGL
jgi:branched-chain amino acid transport system ATP-binding protein